MSKQFTVHKIFHLIKPATVPSHSQFDDHYTNETMQGKIFAIDEAGDLFVMNFDSIINEPSTFRSKGKKAKKLYRDYWRHVSPSFDAPYTKSIMQGEHDILWELK